MARDLDTIKSEIKALKEKSTFLKKNGEVNKRYAEEYNALLKEQNILVKGNSKDMLAARKSELNIAKSIKSIDSQIIKSNQSKLSLLLKGNIAGLLNTKYTSATLTLQKKSTQAQENFADALRDGVKNQNLTNNQRKELLNLQSDVGTGLAEEIDLKDRINDIEELSINQKATASAIMMQQAKARVKINDAENEGGKAQERVNKGLAKGALVFGALLAIAKTFAGSVDAIGKQFGSLNVLSQGFQKNLFDSQEAVVGLGATMEDVVSTANELSSEFGIGLEESADLSAQIIDTAKAVGLSNEEAAKLSGILQVTSGLSSEQAERLSEGAFQLAAANNVNPSAVLKDMAASAEEFALFSKDGGDNLARAAVQARAMGLSLQDTTKAASTLLDFEQSIAAEVEASVLIGRQLNLQKARELALVDDIEGMTRELVKQVGSEAEFNELNSIQREALAKSLGFEASQLAKMVANSEKANVAAGETAKSFSDIIGKEAMSELTATMNELKIFGVAIANTLGPPLMALAKLVNLVLVPLGEGIAGISSAIRGTFGSATSMNDGVVGRGGISMMAGPAGVFSLNPRDSVMATTNPIPVNDIRSGPAGSMGGAQKQTIVMNSRIRGRDLVFLNDRPNAGGDAGYEGLV